MILYLDSSNIVKLYAREPDTDEMKRQAAQADDLASSRIAYVEVRSALARKHREGLLSSADYFEVISSFDVEWTRFVVVEVTQQLVELAAQFSDAHRLRSLDAIHLASAKLLGSEMRTRIRLSSSDQRLLGAAVSEGLA